MTGSGVFIYNAPQLTGDVISISGNAGVTLTAATGGPYAGVAIFQDRTSAAPISVSGNGQLQVGGTIYAAGATVELTGNESLALAGSSVRLIAADLHVSGNGELTVNAGDGFDSSGEGESGSGGTDGSGDRQSDSAPIFVDVSSIDSNGKNGAGTNDDSDIQDDETVFG